MESIIKATIVGNQIVVEIAGNLEDLDVLYFAIKKALEEHVEKIVKRDAEKLIEIIKSQLN